MYDLAVSTKKLEWPECNLPYLSFPAYLDMFESDLFGSQSAQYVPQQRAYWLSADRVRSQLSLSLDGNLLACLVRWVRVSVLDSVRAPSSRCRECVGVRV
jgi:hypothetical protein